MGIFKFFKDVKTELDRRNGMLNMPSEELAKLSDEDLLEAIQYRMEREERILEISECLTRFYGAKRIFYIVNYFDMEVQNGGLCQFFVNSSSEVAPFLQECLLEIKANAYETLFTDFIIKHQIDVKNLSSFKIEDVDEYEAQCERYPFDDFDDAYYALYEENPLEQCLLAYVKQNLEDFD